jgi:methionyl-tRNA formyltransferase
MHPTLLPEGRGRASIPWAIIKGLSETGVSMFKLDEGMDTGPILDQISIRIDADETSTTLYEKVVAAHRALIRKTLASLEAGIPKMRQQDESLATEWPGRRPEDGELQLSRFTVEEVDRYVRALTRPYPGAFVRLADGRRLTIWSGRAGDVTAKDPGAYLLTATDGSYSATDYELA